MKSQVGNLRYGVMLLALFAGCQATPAAQKTYATTRPSAAVRDVIEQFEIDPRLTLCNIQQRPDGSLVGEVEMPQHRELLRAAKFNVDAVRLLPEESTTTDRFGIVTVEHAILRHSPKETRGDRENVTDLLRGETCWILDRNADGWTLVHSPDGYIGWAAPETILWQYGVEDFHAQILHPQATTRAFERPLEIVTGVTTRPSTAVIKAIREAQATQARLTRNLVIGDAQGFLGTRYVWGGKTKDGIDCSGLTQMAFALNGILLPRDADQQANVGRLVATRYFKGALLPGDLLFFAGSKRGNISHVALHMGDGKYIEAAGKVGVRIASMNPSDADYDEKRTKTFAWARRVID